MSNITVTIFEILKGELHNAGFSEMVNNHQITFFNDKYAFIKKVMNYDDDVVNIVNVIFFQGLSLENSDSDKAFKRDFVNRFLHRQIAFQTVEVFTATLCAHFISNLDYLNEIYTNINKYIKNEKEDNRTTTHQTDDRDLMSTLPQTEVNLNVDNTVLDYGDENRISRRKETHSDTGSSSEYSLDNLLKTKNLKEQIFLEIDKKCFLQVW